jgi:hypothetical protein
VANTPSILVPGASRGIGKATARDRSSYLTGSGRLQARGRSRLLVKAVMALITLTAMAAAMFAVPATSHAAPASTKLVWIPRAGYRIAAFVHPGRGPRSCCATASRTTTTCTTVSRHCSRGMRS